MNNFNYQSKYAPFFHDFIAIKKGLGFGSKRTEWILLEFDNFFLKKSRKGIGITKEQIDEWRSTRINDAPSTIYSKYSILSQFCKYMCRIGYNCYVPRLSALSTRNNFTPHIFSKKDILAIFKASDQLVLYDRHMSSNLFVIPAIIRLLYGTGLRINEALSLKNQDIDLDKRVLYVRKSKMVVIA
jgi:integrase